MDNLFEIFLKQWNLSTIQQAFYQLCINKGVDPTDYTNVYEKLKQADRFCDSNFKQKQLWNLLDARRQQKVYQNQTVCRGMNVLIIGAGPCGLRAAIECSLLGAHVVVVDSRDKFTRNNILHLWKFVIEDLKNLGAKIFMPKFCTGSIEHIAIRKLQFILLKVALVLGVQFYDKVEYKDLKEPQDGKGWRATFEPSDHLLSDYEFDVVFGASGKNKCLPAFKHNPVRGKLAIGITANFVRHKNKEEDGVPEIQGVAYVYKQDYFDDLERRTKIQLENIVYYKGDTHYFVMCGKKDNLIAKGVIKENKEDIKSLLASENVDNEMLCKYITQVVDYATEGKLGQLEFALNARKKPDIAAFDFTTLESADHSTRFVKYMGHPLILSLVGDYLHEPFWPTGSGCARGFLSVMDTAWLLRKVGLGKEPMARLLGEREGIYSLLSQTQPNNLSNLYHTYTIDPAKRYKRFNPNIPCVDHLMGSDENEEDLAEIVMKVGRQTSLNVEFHQRSSLFRFCFMAALSKKIRISSFCRSSWADGCALATLISKYNPDFMPTVPITNSSNPSTLCRESFLYAQQELNVESPCKTQYEWAQMKECDRISYLQNLVEVLRANPFYVKNCMSPTLLISYNQDKLIASAFQDRILKPRQVASNTNFDFNFAALESCVTVRQKRQQIDISTVAPPNKRRSSIGPLNPELVHKINNIASNASKKVQSDQNEIVDEKISLKISEEKTEINSRLVIQRDSLAGLNTVSKFKEKFDTVPIKLASNSTTSSQRSDTDTSSSTEDEHPADPMQPSSGLNTRQISSNANGTSNVVYRSTTQHQFINSRRPISTPSMLNSPDLLKTFGHPTKAINLAQQQVYKTVSQRRMKCCALCQKEVYLTEQLIVDDRLAVHKNCFRCSFCNRNLEVGKAYIDRSFVDKFGVRWFCAQHTSKSQFEKLQQLSKITNKQKSSTVVAIVSPTKLELPPKPSFSQRTFASSSTESSTTSLHELEHPSHEKLAILESHEVRPPTPPNKGRLSNSTKYRKRLSNLNSPTQLIEACKERTNQRLVLLGLKDIVIDENLELKSNDKWQKSEQTSSDQENDRQSSESFEETLDDEEEYLEIEEEFLSEDDQQIENCDAWDELKSYLENALIDSQTQFCNPNSNQARDLIENFNRLSLLNHFNNNNQTPVSKLIPQTPYFTPREGRSETVPVETEVYFTPRSTIMRPGIMRRSSTLDRGASMEVDQLKMKIQQNAGQFEKPKEDPQTPQRSNRQRFRRGPRRATVAIDLKRESLAPDDIVASANLKDQQKSELSENSRNGQVPIAKIRRSPSQQQRRQAFHIRPTDENLERVIKEIETMKNQRKNEKERQLQSFQRRLDELEVRITQVCNMGKYLESNLRSSPRNKWELEQWLTYSQQFEELRNEEQQLKYKLQIAQLEDQYSQLKIRLHAQQDSTITAENLFSNEKSEKEIMERLLELLNEKDSVKALLNELQSEVRTRTPPSELVEHAPSYTCYSAVFLENESRPTFSNKSSHLNGRIPV